MKFLAHAQTFDRGGGLLEPDHSEKSKPIRTPKNKGWRSFSQKNPITLKHTIRNTDLNNSVNLTKCSVLNLSCSFRFITVSVYLVCTKWGFQRNFSSEIHNYDNSPSRTESLRPRNLIRRTYLILK